MLFTIFVQCVLVLRSDSSGRTNRKWLTAYSCAVYLLATCGLASNMKFVQMCYIDYRNYPGGPNAFTFDFYSHWVNMFGAVAYVVMTWLADGLMVHRLVPLSYSEMLIQHTAISICDNLRSQTAVDAYPKPPLPRTPW